MRPILYTSGDSVVWGAELKDKSRERFSYLVSEELDMVDCNKVLKQHRLPILDLFLQHQETAYLDQLIVLDYYHLSQSYEPSTDQDRGR